VDPPLVVGVMSVFGYVRVSTRGQIDGESLGLQRERIEAWCRFQRLELDAIYEDAGISGSTTDHRTGFQTTMKAALQRGEGATLIVMKLDRLGRNAIDVQEALAVLLHARVRVVSLADGLDSASGMGATLLKLLTSVLSTFAELERETIRSRLSDARRRADRENRAYASEPRYGRQVAEDGRTLVEDQAERLVIDRVRALRAEGLSYGKIAAQLLVEGHRPRRAATWATCVVRRMDLGRRNAEKPRTSSRIEQAHARWLGTAVGS
jgi:site-specific DNA recombinase